LARFYYTEPRAGGWEMFVVVVCNVLAAYELARRAPPPAVLPRNKLRQMRTPCLL